MIYTCPECGEKFFPTHRNNVYCSAKCRKANEITGVRQNKNGSYTAGISVKGKFIYLGNFLDYEKAVEARLDAEEEYRDVRENRPTYEERLDMAKETAWMIQRLLCSRWSKIKYPYEAIIEYGV